MNAEFIGRRRNAGSDSGHDIGGGEKNGTGVYGTRVPLVHSSQEKRFRGLGLVAS